jgi:hypothetical protein
MTRMVLIDVEKMTEEEKEELKELRDNQDEEWKKLERIICEGIRKEYYQKANKEMKQKAKTNDTDN